MTAEDVFRPADTVKARVAAFLRALLFLVATPIYISGVSLLVARLFGPQAAQEIDGLFWGSGLAIAATLAIALGLTAALAYGGKRPFGSYGLGGTRCVRRFAIGLGIGAAALAAEMLLIWAGNGVAFGPVHGDEGAYAFAFLLMFVGIGLSEEVVFRGYALVELSRALSFWPAALILGALFGGLHLANGATETVWGALAAAAFGVVFAALYRWSGSLWLPIGLHGGWNFAESYLFGMPNSGVVLMGRLLHAQPQGPAWLSGGSAGPEASPFVLVPLAGFVLLALSLRHKKPA